MKVTKARKDQRKAPETTPKQGIKWHQIHYLPIITLNVNGLNVQLKRHRVTEWVKNKTQLYAACKGLILDVKTPAD